MIIAAVFVGLGPVGGHNPEMPPLAYHDALHFRQTMHPLTLFKQFGSRDESPAGLESPHGACFGKNGEVVIADTGNHQIKVNFFYVFCLGFIEI